MLSKYVDLILWVSILGAMLTIYLIYLVNNLTKELKNLRKINELLGKVNGGLAKENKTWRVDAPKILMIGEINADDIKCLKEQVALINRWLAEVLNISNLLPSKEAGIEVTDIIDELKQRIKWNEEIAKQRDKDESIFYKGD